MTWTTWDLGVAGGVGVLLGLWLGLNGDLWLERLRLWWRRRQMEKRSKGHRKTARMAWGLDQQELATFDIVRDRWVNDRCVFCGRENGDGPRCDAQVEYALQHGTPTWESESFLDVARHVFAGSTDEALEVEG